MCPLPEVSPSLTVLPGSRLQKPFRGTTLRLSRSANDMEETETPAAVSDFLTAGNFAGDFSDLLRSKYSLERSSLGGAWTFALTCVCVAALVSDASSGAITV